MHRTLAHDLLDQNHSWSTGSPDVGEGLLAYRRHLGQLGDLLADGVHDDVAGAVSREGAAPFHAGALFDLHVDPDHDVVLVGAARASVADLLVHEPLAGAELMDLHAGLVHARQHEDHTREHIGDAVSQTSLRLRGDRDDVHDRVGEDVPVLGSDDVHGHLPHQRIGGLRGVGEGAVDGQRAVPVGGRRADRHGVDREVLLDQGAQHPLGGRRLGGRWGGW
ncbi:hypothetical protein [Acidipropionibacterium jensenii]|uniref:hypothetical protein n=1 Tax=Acidipropionibacterium jensenii TaxID=1749 RepID=UPI00214C746A|nr:hypothetical protein [Acidipropionibacterium jensenii]